MATVPGTQIADTVQGTPAADILFGYRGADLILGNPGDDRAYGGQDADTLFGGQGQDTLSGDLGDDLLFGNLGEDLLFGNQGNDTLYGGQGNDTLYGGQGDDLLYGDLGDNTLYGDLGFDTAVLRGRRSDYTITRGANDTFVLVGTTGTTRATGVEFFRFDDDTVAAGDLFSDGSGGGGGGTPVNRAPQANPDENSYREDSGTPVAGNVLKNDTDPDNPPGGNVGLVVANPGTYEGTYGTTTINRDGSYTYTPKDIEPTDNGAGGFRSGPYTDQIPYTVVDAGGARSSSTLTITTTPVNDAPTLTATGTNPTFTEGDGSSQGDAATLFSGAQVDTVENGQTITSLTFTVSGLRDGANETVLVAGTPIALTDGNRFVPTPNSWQSTGVIGYSVAVTGGVATVTLTPMNGLTEQDAQDLVNGLAYQNTNVDNPTPGNRTVTLTRIQDSGGTDNNGQDARTVDIASSITVASTNERPVVTAGRTLAYTIKQEPASIDPSVRVTDVDGRNSTRATVQITGNFVSGQDVLSINMDTTSLVNNMITISGSPVLAGPYEGYYQVLNPGYDNIYVKFSDDRGAVMVAGVDTRSHYQDVLRAVRYSNQSDAPSTAPRTVTFTATDEDNATSLAATGTITIAPANSTQNRAPVAVADEEYNFLIEPGSSVTPVNILRNDFDLDRDNFRVDTVSNLTASINDAMALVSPSPGALPAGVVGSFSIGEAGSYHLDVFSNGNITISNQSASRDRVEIEFNYKDIDQKGLQSIDSTYVSLSSIG